MILNYLGVSGSLCSPIYWELVLSSCRKKPKKVTYGLGAEEHDGEGRLITAEFDDLFLVNTCALTVLNPWVSLLPFAAGASD